MISSVVLVVVVMDMVVMQAQFEFVVTKFKTLTSRHVQTTPVSTTITN